jgi:uncharacterized protein with GYD domain
MALALYISLLRYTQKAVENLKDSPKRLEATKKAFEAAGGNLKAIYWTLGQYDAIAISEFPNDQTGLAVNLAGAMQGYIRSETLRAFTEDEFRNAVALLP